MGSAARPECSGSLTLGHPLIPCGQRRRYRAVRPRVNAGTRAGAPTSETRGYRSLNTFSKVLQPSPGDQRMPVGSKVANVSTIQASVIS